jgi:hypothetical protein
VITGAWRCRAGRPGAHQCHPERPGAHQCHPERADAHQCHPERSEGGHLRLSLLPSLLLLLAAPSLAAQDGHIADNSFLIEEAYNQEAGVVQHITTFNRAEAGHVWALGFTQEWPLGGIRNQLSYTIPLVRPGAGGTGFGDVLIHYRHQALGNGGSELHVAPRLSLVLPTGSEEKGRGSGALGLQTNVPVSVVVSPAVATHYNAGLSLEGESGSVDAHVAASAILRVRRWINFMLETAWSSADEDVVLLNPGVRWAFELESGFQIVPGLAYTVALGGGEPDALFIYLSLEHPFR